jgi:hypothetical protein
MTFSFPGSAGLVWCSPYTVRNTVLQVDAVIFSDHTKVLKYGIDGYNRSHIAINGQMPGPLIEANEGDTLMSQSFLRVRSVFSFCSLNMYGLDSHRYEWLVK